MTGNEWRMAGPPGGGGPPPALAAREIGGAWPNARRRRAAETASRVTVRASPPHADMPSVTDIPSVLILRNDGIFVSKTRFRGLMSNIELAAALASRDIYLLAPSGEEYLRPRIFQARFPEEFASRLDREGLPPAVLESPAAPSGPAVIVRTSQHIFVPAESFADRRVPSAFTAKSIFLKDAGKDGGFICLATLEQCAAPIELSLTSLQLELIGSQIESRFDRDPAMAAWREFGPEGSGGSNEIVGDENGVH